MDDVRVLGIDPGPIPGLVALCFPGGHPKPAIHVVQCSHGIAPRLLRTLLDLGPEAPTWVQIERFVVGRKSMRAGRAGEITRDLIGRCAEVVAETGGRPGRFHYRNASTVKAWATDKRLDRLGLLEATIGMPHARDAGRHALYCAVADAGMPDPLSAKAGH